MLALDSTSRILAILAYSGAGAAVGLVTGLVLRAMFREAKRAAAVAKREAEEALVIADEARDIAWEARDEAHPVEA